MNTKIPNDAIFWDQEGAIYLIANWRERAVIGGQPALIRLNARPLRLYLRYKTQGRSQKSIYYLLIKHKDGLSTTRATRPDGKRIPSRRLFTPLESLTKDQLVRLCADVIGERAPYLLDLGLKDLRHLYQALLKLRGSKP